MGSRARRAWTERRLLRQLRKDLATFEDFDRPASEDFDRPARPPRHKAKDFLGAVVTLAIIGAILLELTNGLASQCGAKLSASTGNPRTCSGVAAVADQARGAVDLTVATCAALAVITFVWYMFWGYKTSGQPHGSEERP
jgi:hypothetical protein